MTLDELAALPEVPSGFGMIEDVVEGRKVRRVVAPATFALFMGPDDGEYHDANGDRWLTGWAFGVHYKRKMSQL